MADKHNKSKIEIINTSVAVAGLVIALGTALFGGNWVRQVAEKTEALSSTTEQLETTTEQLKTTTEQLETTTKQLETKFQRIIDENPNPTDEIVSEPLGECSYQSFDLCDYNIDFGDNQTDVNNVKGWLDKEESGYPKLARAIQSLMDGKRLKSNSVPLVMINAEYLALLERNTGQPVRGNENINQDVLKQAILSAWTQKNGPYASSLDEAVE